MSTTEKIEEKESVKSANYTTVEVRTEEEIENERRAYVEQVELENQEKAINNKAKRSRADKTFIRITVGVFVVIMAVLIMRYLMGWN